MAAIWATVRRGVRKTPGQHLTTVLLAAIAAAMLSIGLVLALAYPAGLQRTVRELDTENLLTIITAEPLANEAERFLADQPEVSAHDLREIRVNYVTILGFKNADLTAWALFSDHADPPSIGNSAVVEELDEQLSDGIYIPYQVAINGGYQLGDPIEFQIGPDQVPMHVQGIIESAFTGSTLMGLLGFELPPQHYERFIAERSVNPAWAVRAQLHDPDQVAGIETALTEHLDDEGVAENPGLVPSFYSNELVMPMLQMTSALFAGLLVAFALLIGVVAAVVIGFQVRSTIVRDMPAIGTMKATGFTSMQVIRSISLPHVLSVTAGALLGVVLGHFAMPAVAQSLAAQTGLRWTPGLQPAAALITLVALIGAAALTGLVVARRVRRIPPVDALRGGFTTHSFKRNHFPLDRSSGKIDLLIGLKQAARRPAQNIMIALVVALVTFTTVFGAAGIGFLAKPATMYDLILGDWEQIWAAPAPGTDREQIRERLAAEPGVEQAYYHDMFLTASAPMGSVVVEATEDYGAMRTTSIYEGRPPELPNEVAIGSQVREQGDLEIGDQITLSLSGRSESYLITGFAQSGWGLGLSVSLTTAGYEGLNPQYEPYTLLVRGDGSVPLDELIDRVRQDYRTELYSVLRSDDYRSSILGAIAVAANGLAWLFLLVCALIVLLVIGLVASGAILATRHETGVKKALGFTTGQLTRQLVASYLPQTVAGVIVGLLAGWAFTEPILSAANRPTGIVRMPVQPELSVLLGSGALILALTIATLLLFSFRLRRISAHSLIRD